MELKIVATSDMHGYVMPTNYAEKNMNMNFGTSKVATMLKKIRQEATGPVLAIENGDFIQGSPLSYYVKKQEGHDVSELTQVINQMSYDVGVLGNHEFNYGMDYLKAAVASYQHPVVCANILTESGESLTGKPYVILEKMGVKIAVLGVTTQYIPNWEQPATIKGLRFESLVSTVKRYLPELRQQADVVVVSYHGGFERDLETGEPTELITGENEAYQLLHEVEGIDALITGHQHRVIASEVNGVPVIQPGYRGQYLGEISLTLEQGEKGYRVVSHSVCLHEVDESVVADPEMIETMSLLQEEVETWLDQTMGKVNGDMRIYDPHQARLVEHPYIEFIQKVQMEASGADISGTALFNNEGRGFEPEITMRDIITNYIYPNTLAVLKVSGKDLKDALEQTSDHFVVVDGEITFNPKFMLPKPQYYNYDMYEGVDYTIDYRQPLGNRVTKLTYHGKTVQETDELEIVTNQYRAVGGGNYRMFRPEKIIREIQIDMTELIADYLKKHPVIDATANHNFTILK